MTVVYAVAMSALVIGAVAALWQPRLGALCSAAGCVLLVVVGVDAAVGGARPVLELGGWLGFGTSGLRADGVAGIFLALTGLTGAGVAFAYAGSPPGRGLTCLSGTLLALVAVAIGADNAFLFFLAWEGLTVCVYLIASAARGQEELLAGYLTGGLAKLGGGALMAAFGLLYAHTHSFSLHAWAHASLSPGTRGVAFALLLACFATKIGVLPLQGGLPAGYGAAPRLGAASLSVALCAGFYGLWRFAFQILGPLPVWCGDAMLILGASTALVGIVYALTQDNLRRFLGYSTVEHAGIVLVGLGVALLGQSARQPILAAAGLLAATLHVCAHNLAKTLALITVDRVEQATGRRTIGPLGGLRPAAAARARGLRRLLADPGGDSAVRRLRQRVVHLRSAPAGFSHADAAVAAPVRLGCRRAGAHGRARSAGVRQVLQGIHLSRPGAKRRPTTCASRAAGRLACGARCADPVPRHGRAVGDPRAGVGTAVAAGLQPRARRSATRSSWAPCFRDFSVLAPTWLAIVLPAYALLFAVLVRALLRPPVRAPVWVTGSGAELAAVQYRPSAYSNPMRVILRGPLGYRTSTAEPGRPSPSTFRCSRHAWSCRRRSLPLPPAAAGALRVAARVRRLQSGRLSAYLLYMLVALIVALALIPILR